MSLPPLWDHQGEFIGKSLTLDHGGALFEPGCGKTRAVIEALRDFYRAKGGIQSTLVFAPISVCPGWKKEFLKYSKVPEDQILVLVDSGIKRVKAMERALHSGKPLIVVTNYEAVQIHKFYEMLLKWSPRAVVADESHRLKDPAGMRARRIMPFAQAADKRFIMTGTFTPNSLLDIYGQIKILEPNYFGKSFWEFRSKYFFDKNAYMPKHAHFPDWKPKPEAARMIGSVISACCTQAKKSDCLDLPDLQEIKVPVQIEGDQKKAYLSMEKDFVASCGEVVSTAEFAMTRTLRLQQILAGFLSTPENEVIQWFKDNTRMKALDDLIDSLGGEQFILWTGFRPTYEVLAKLCGRHSLRVGMITGEQSAKEKQEAIEGFKSGHLRAVVANPAAAGEGIDGLQCSRYSIYYNRGYNSTHFEQSKARNYRGGSEVHDKVVHYHLTAEGTLDEVIASALLNKRRVSEEVLEWAKKTIDSY